MTKIILASASPRRAQLLWQLGLTFDICPADIDESPRPNESAAQLVTRLAQTKAAANNDPSACIIAADTVISHAGRIFGKPRDSAEALVMLQRLAGQKHHVYTGLALRTGNKQWHDCVATAVTMIPFEPALFAAYVASGEPRDKAGGYGIQGRGAVLIAEIAGDYSNVVGLPLSALCRGLHALGWGEELRRALASTVQ